MAGDTMGPSAGAIDSLLMQVTARLREFDGRLAPDITDQTLVVVEPASGWPVRLGLAGDGRGSTKLFASTRVDRSLSRVLGANLGRMLGMVQVLPVEGEAEVRRWSPYRLEDIERTPQEAIAWSVTTIETMLEELRARGRAVTPAPKLDPYRVYSFDPGPQRGVPPAPIVQEPITVPPVVEALTVQPRAGADAEIEALERRIADYEALNVAVSAELATARAESVRQQGLLGAATRERDEAQALAKQLAARSDVPPTPAANPGPKLLGAFLLLVDAGTRPSTCIEVLRRFLDIAPADPQLLEELGVHLLKDNRVPEAFGILGDLGADGLSPKGASAFVEASLRQKTLPSDLAILGRVDWRPGNSNVATYLRDVPAWAPREALLDVTEVVAQGGPPEFAAFLQAVARAVPSGELERLFAIWFDVDALAALDQLLGWVDDKRASISQQWVREAVELAAGEEDRRNARRALDVLADDAAHRRDVAALLDLIDGARARFKQSEWRPWAVPWLREAASACTSPALADRCAAMALDALRDMPAAREEDPEYVLARFLGPKVSPDVAIALQAELDRLRPVDITVRDVTTVSEALRAAKERFVGLVVLADAERSAAKRGTVGVAKAREALFALGEIADRYARGELDDGLDEALGALPGYKPDVSDSAKNQYRQDYLKTLPDKGKVMLGPHIDIGGGDAGRAYFSIDRKARRIILGHAGAHLRGKQDT